MQITAAVTVDPERKQCVGRQHHEDRWPDVEKMLRNQVAPGGLPKTQKIESPAHVLKLEPIRGEPIALMQNPEDINKVDV